MTYAVNHWGGKPGTDDNLHNAHEFESRDEAEAVYRNPRSTFGTLTEGDWFELDGPDVHEERPVKRGEWSRSRASVERDEARFDREWASERRWEHRMLYGRDDI